jgi:hypothetical protein
LQLPGSLAAMATGHGTAHAAAGVEAALGPMRKTHIRGCIAFDVEQARCVTLAGKLGGPSTFVPFEPTTEAAINTRMFYGVVDPRVATSRSTWQVLTVELTAAQLCHEFEVGVAHPDATVSEPVEAATPVSWRGYGELPLSSVHHWWNTIDVDKIGLVQWLQRCVRGQRVPLTEWVTVAGGVVVCAGVRCCKSSPDVRLWTDDGRFFCVECWHHFELNRFDRNLAVAVNGASTVAASATSTSSTSDLPHKRSHVDDGVSRSGEESHPRGKRRKNA